MVNRILPPLFMAAGVAAIASAEPTFNKDVLPILQNRCQGCHRPGEAAPMSFLTYKDTRPRAAAIREAVSTRKMPPWHADAAHGTFRNERRLTDAEIETLSQWAKTGAKEGDPKAAPAPRQFAEGWTKEVLWGGQSREEMLIGFVDFAIPVGLDPTGIAKGKPAPTSGGE